MPFITFNVISYGVFLSGCVDALKYMYSGLFSTLNEFHPFALMISGLCATVVIVGFFKLL